ncbi:MAG: hypothetical protein QM756_24890 [Polyangiaceae bacterium]
MAGFASKLRVWALPFAWLSACAGPTFILQQYDGPARAADSVAIVRFEGSGTVDMVSIDGASADAHVPEDARLHVEVLPGKHVLGVANRAAPSGPPRRVAFLAEAGRTYRVVFTPPPPNDWLPVPRVFEIDARSGAQLKEATLVPTMPKPRAAAAEAAAPAAAPVEAAPASEAKEPSGAAGAASE